VTAWPLWIAKETGALQKYNIDADVILTDSGRTVPGVLNGQTPMSFMDGNDIFSPNVQGADLVAVMVTGNKPTDMIVGGRSTTDPQQLVGKAVGVNALTDETTAEMRYALDKGFKLAPDSVRIVSIGDESLRIAALASDQVQATVIDASEKDQVIAQGFHPLYNFLEGDLPWNKNVLMTTKKFASENPKKVECLLMAMLEAGATFKSDEQKSVDIASKYSEGMDRPSLETTWKTYATVYPDLPTVDPKGFALQQQLNTDPGAKSLDLNTLVDNSYLQHLKDAGFLDTLPHS
jgi:ABC-type nitrate/sulfonate/bicarbonate transport system substrate-binding protein